MLNNKPVFQIGPLDQGWWPDGLLTPPSDEAMKYDIEVPKKLGFNMLRKHVKVEPARWYYHCDKLGLLVWQDMPSGGMPSRRQHIAPNAKEDATFTAEEKKQFRTRTEGDDRPPARSSRASSSGCRSTKAGASTTPTTS